MDALRWERWMHWPLIAAAALFLLGYAWPILQPDLGPAGRLTAEGLVWGTWALFALDFLVRVWLAPRRLGYVRSHLLELAVVALPILRPLRLLRLITLLSILNREAGSSLRGRLVTYVTGSTVLLALVAALAVLDSERGAPGSTINTFGDAMWWTVTTITTVGYGDLAPVTGRGRLVAVVLMIAGIAVLGLVTATLASWLVERISDENEAEQVATRAHIEELSAAITLMSDQLTAFTEAPERGPSSPGVR